MVSSGPAFECSKNQILAIHLWHFQTSGLSLSPWLSPSYGGYGVSSEQGPSSYSTQHQINQFPPVQNHQQNMYSFDSSFNQNPRMRSMQVKYSKNYTLFFPY